MEELDRENNVGSVPVKRGLVKLQLVKFLIVAWFIACIVVTSRFCDPNRSNILTKLGAFVGSTFLVYVELWIIQRLQVKINARFWFLILFVLFTADFTVGFYMMDRLVWIALLIVAAGIVLGIVGIFMGNFTTVTTTYRTRDGSTHKTTGT